MTGVAAGTATITATGTVGTVTKTKDVTVTVTPLVVFTTLTVAPAPGGLTTRRYRWVNLRGSKCVSPIELATTVPTNRQPSHRANPSRIVVSSARWQIGSSVQLTLTARPVG